jgi:hypothetical protein
VGQVGHFVVVAHLCVTTAATVVSFLEGGGERKREREREKKGGTRWTLKLCISLSQVDNTFMVRHLDEMGLRVAHFAGCS